MFIYLLYPARAESQEFCGIIVVEVGFWFLMLMVGF